jgi:hypothetical protein
LIALKNIRRKAPLAITRNAKCEPSYPGEKLPLIIAVAIPLPILAAFIGRCSKELTELQIQNLL